MKIRVPKALLLRLYCYSFQAERSIHYALGADWSDLRAYYKGARLEGVRQLTQDMQGLLAAKGIPAAPEARSPRRAVAEPGLWQDLVVSLYRVSLGQLIARWGKYWSFTEEEVCRFTSTLVALVKVVESTRRPEQDDLIALRMDLFDCRNTIEWRCYGLPEIQRTRWLEHFRQADWITPVRLMDILAKQPPVQQPRRSA